MAASNYRCIKNPHLGLPSRDGINKPPDPSVARWSPNLKGHESMLLTKDGHDDVIFDDFYGASGDEVERHNDVTLVHQSVARWRMRRLEFH